MASGFDISASNSQSSAANPVAQFGNVYGGGNNKVLFWGFIALVVAGGTYLLWRWLK